MTEDGEMVVDVEYGSGRIKGTGGYAKTGSLNPSRLLHKLETDQPFAYLLLSEDGTHVIRQEQAPVTHKRVQGQTTDNQEWNRFVALVYKPEIQIQHMLDVCLLQNKLVDAVKQSSKDVLPCLKMSYALGGDGTHLGPNKKTKVSSLGFYMRDPTNQIFKSGISPLIPILWYWGKEQDLPVLWDHAFNTLSVFLNREILLQPIGLRVRWDGTLKLICDNLFLIQTLMGGSMKSAARCPLCLLPDSQWTCAGAPLLPGADALKEPDSFHDCGMHFMESVLEECKKLQEKRDNKDKTADNYNVQKADRVKATQETGQMGLPLLFRNNSLAHLGLCQDLANKYWDIPGSWSEWTETQWAVASTEYQTLLVSAAQWLRKPIEKITDPLDPSNPGIPADGIVPCVSFGHCTKVVFLTIVIDTLLVVCS